jgi:hypothetical protein
MHIESVMKARRDLSEIRQAMHLPKSRLNPTLAVIINHLGCCDRDFQIQGIHRLAKFLPHFDSTCVTLFSRHSIIALPRLFHFAFFDPTVSQMALLCLAGISRMGFRFPPKVVQEFTNPDVLNFLLQALDDPENSDNSCVVLSRFAIQSRDVCNFLIEAAILPKVLSLPITFCYGCLLYAFVKYGIGAELVDVIRERATAMIEGPNLFNVKYGMKIAMRLDLQQTIAELPRVLEILATSGERKIVSCTLKLLLNSPHVSIEVLAVVYGKIDVWGMRSTLAGIRLLTVHFEAFLGIVAEVGIGPLISCIVGRELKVKAKAFEMLITIDRRLIVTDLAVLEGLFELADSDQFYEQAVEMLAAINSRFVSAGKEEEFLTAISEFDGQLSDLETSKHELVSQMAQSMRLSLIPIDSEKRNTSFTLT